MNIEKLKKIFYKSILIILLVMAIYVAYCTIFNIYKSNQDLKPSILIIGTIVSLAFFIILKNRINKIKHIKIIARILCVIFFIGMCIVGILVTSIPSTDLSLLIREGNIMLENGGTFESESYFARVPNQTPVTILIYLIFKIGTYINIPVKIFATIINSLFIAIAAYFTFLSIEKVKGKKAGLITLIFFILNPIFYLYSSYFYTDTLCMPFAMISIYLILCSLKQENNKKKIILSIISGAILALGFEIRVVLGIFLIAMIMTSISRKMFHSLAIIAGFILGIIIYNLISIPFGVLENKDLEFPITHFIMYSLNEESVGKWNSEDYQITYSQKTYEEKVNENLKVIKQRLRKLGLSGWLTLAKEKLAVNWSNGDYDYSSKLENVEDINVLYEYVAGNKKLFIMYYLQICKSTIMVAFAFAIIKEIYLKENEKHNKFIYISMFGAFIFYLFWEVLSRYSLTFLPLLMLTFIDGLDFAEDKIINLKNNRKVLKNGGLIIIIITVFLGTINFEKYAIRQNTYYDKVAVQAKSNESGIEEIAEKEIVQEFTADKKFNSIAIKFLKQDLKETTHYYFTICDVNGEELVKQSFDSDSIKDSTWYTFSFESIEPEGEQKYIIKISSEDATQDNSIGIATYNGYGNYDIYPNGNLYLDGEEVEQDISFKVQNKRSRTYISKKLYLVLMFTILAIEIYTFYPYIKKEE